MGGGPLSGGPLSRGPLSARSLLRPRAGMTLRDMLVLLAAAVLIVAILVPVLRGGFGRDEEPAEVLEESLAAAETLLERMRGRAGPPLQEECEQLRTHLAEGQRALAAVAAEPADTAASDAATTPPEAAERLSTIEVFLRETCGR